MNRKNLEWWCEQILAYLVLGMLVFAPLAFGGVDAWALLPLQLAGFAAGGLWVARLWLAEKTRVLWPPLTWAVLAFVVYAVGWYFFADIEYVARGEVLQVVWLAVVFLVVMNHFRSQEAIERLSWVLISVATLAACFAVWQLLARTDRVWNVYSGYTARASGTYISPNHFACFMEMVLPLALAFLLVGKMSVVGRILLAYAVGVMGVALLGTFSRAGYVAAAGGVGLLLVWLLGHRNHRLRAMILLGVLLLAGGVFVTHYLSKTAGFSARVKADPDAPGVYDWQTRLKMWGAAREMWQDHFWLGVGPAHYDYRFRQYRPVEVQARPMRCHNDYLNLLADWGVIGGGIVLGAAVIFVIGLRQTAPRVRREENDLGTSYSNRHAFFLGATCALFALAIHSLMDFNLHIPANALVGVVLLALLAGNIRYATERHWLRAGPGLKMGLAIAMTLLLLGFFWHGWRTTREIFWLAQAEREGNYSPERAAALQRAFAAESNNPQTAYDIGECYRTLSLEGGKDFQALTQQAMDWYARGIRLNPRDGYNYLRTGMCLTWLGRHAEAEPFYSAAEERDPNGYYMVSNLGWRYVQMGNFVAARQCFERSIALSSLNPTARNYLMLLEPKLVERASGKVRFPGFFNGNDR